MSDKSTPVSDPVVLSILSAKKEADQAKENRMRQNRENMDCFHMKQDWSHKKAGQSREFLAKQNVATEQLVSFLQQGLIDRGDWFSIDLAPGVRDSDRTITAADMFKILKNQLEKADFYSATGDGLKVGALQSLMIFKIHGRQVPTVKFRTEDRKDETQPQGVIGRILGRRRTKKVLVKDERMSWELRISLVRPEDYYPDPTGRGLYEIQDVNIDLWELKEIAAQNPDDYDMDAISALQAHIDETQRSRLSEETGQNTTTETRKQVVVTEFWGTLVDSQSGEIIEKNCVAAIANDRFVIRKPKPNDLWHGESPYVAAPIRRVPFSVWHQGLMDAPTKHNRALNEIYNLMLDSGIQSVFGVRQIREDWLSDPAQIADGIPAGTTLKANGMAPAGAKVMERVDTATEFTQASTIFNLTDREFQASAFTNDTRGGNLPERQVKATEIVATNQVLTGISNGMVKSIESACFSKVLEKAWMTIAQNLDDFSSDEMKALLGEEKAIQISALSPEERFAQTARGHKFKVFGLSTTLNKIQDFKKLQALLQTVAAAPLLMKEFMMRYDMGKFMGEIVKSLDINVDKISKSAAIEDGQGDKMAGAGDEANVISQIQALTPGMQKEGAPDLASQIPQVDSARRLQESGAGVPRSAILSGGMTTPG